MLRLISDRSLFQMAVDRLLPIIPAERVLVVTVSEQAAILQEQAPMLPKSNFILEPEPKGTASVAGLAAILLKNINPESIMAMLTADHFIGNVGKFRELLAAAKDFAEGGDLVTLGITPTYPTTGYGYIQKGQLQGKIGDYRAYRVQTFTEKPSREKAEEYLRDGNFIWNSGMFIWQVGRILDEIARQMPDLYEGLLEIEGALGQPQSEEVLTSVWSKIVPETIDYGIMEGAQRVSVIPADDLGWCDIGSWDRMFEVGEPDQDGNLIIGAETVLKDTRGTLVFQDQAVSGKKLFALLGIEDLIIVHTEDALLLCPRERAEEVRGIVKELAFNEKNTKGK
jgi:mannose-1-phosphate guanylyltransferase